jgi:hypothetical protein
MQLRLEIAEKSTNFGICGSRECALEPCGTGQGKEGMTSVNSLVAMVSVLQDVPIELA